MTKIDPLDETLADLQGITAELGDVTGTVTLKGIPWNDMRSILTSAALYRHDNKKIPVYIDPEGDILDLQKGNAEHERAWNWQQHDLIKFIDAQLLKAGGHKIDTEISSITLMRKVRKRHANEFEPAWTHEKPPADPVKATRDDAIKRLKEAENILIVTRRILST